MTQRTKESRKPGPVEQSLKPFSAAAAFESKQVSRRQFGRSAVMAGAAALSAPAFLASDAAAASSSPAEQKPEPLDGLSPQQVADVDAKLANIVRKYGDRFDADQKSHLRRILAQNERMMAPVRAFHVENGDPPASVLRLQFDQPGSLDRKAED